MNIGIIGTGSIACKLAEAINRVDGAVLYAVLSRSLSKARTFAEKYSVKEWFDSADDFYSRDKIDVVYIASPNSRHFYDTLEALYNNKAVLCEKPFALNSDQAAEMVRLSKENNLFLTEAMWTKYFPAVKKVKDILNDGSLGEIVHISGDLSFPLGEKERLYKKELGGGALYDLGVYPISMAHYYLGKPEKIIATSQFADTGVDKSTSMVFTYKGGVTANLTCSIVANSTNEFLISCTNGWVRINGDFLNPSSISLNIIGKGELHKEFPRETLGYEYQIEGLLADFQSGEKESSTVSHRDTLEVMEIIDRVRDIVGLNG